MPMVWYVPPLSPVVDQVQETGVDAEDVDTLFAAIESLRIPVEYLAELFTAGDTVPVTGVLHKLAAMRSYMRDLNLGRDPRPEIPAGVGMSEEDMYEMYRLLALAPYDERYVIPPAHSEQAHQLEELVTECAVANVDDGLEQDYAGVSGPFGEGSGEQSQPIAVETLQALRTRQTSDESWGPPDKHRRVNLLNWDGQGMPRGLFPRKRKGDVDE
jgi:nitrate reductase beta subunit